MKYIRTKDTIFAVVKELEKVYFVRAKGNNNNIYSKSKCQTNVVSQANTIEDLCDQFVLLDHNKVFLLANNNFSVIKDIWNRRDMEIYIYGAIWTNKGLIYVAKINEKGELELL